MSDFQINPLGGLKFTSTTRTGNTAPTGNSSLLSQNGGVDSFQRSNPLGTAEQKPLTIGGVPIKLDTNSLHSSTLNTLKNPPEHHSLFPPFTDITG